MLTPQLADAYDVVGFDPRGVVNSSPVDCIDDSKLDALFALDGTPDTPEEVAELAAVSKLFGVGCEAKSPDVAPYMDTESAARDMDILRAVLGDEKLNYLGKSYGTYLGAQYAELFPEKVGQVRSRRRSAQLAGLRRDHPRPGQGVRCRPAAVRRGLHHPG